MVGLRPRVRYRLFGCRRCSLELTRWGWLVAILISTSRPRANAQVLAQAVLSVRSLKLTHVGDLGIATPHTYASLACASLVWN